MGSAVICPSCNQRINISTEMMGTTVVCPMCKSQWSMGTPAAPPAQSPASAQPPTYQPPGAAGRDVQPDYGRQTYSQTPDESSSALFWVIGLLGGCLFLVIAGGLGGLLLFRSIAKNMQLAEPNAPVLQLELAGDNLLEARQGFETVIVDRQTDNEPVPTPPDHLFEIVKYDAPLGEMSAYVSKPENPNQKSPAIIWKFGGFGNGIGETAWETQPRDNDQSASAYRKHGIVMMYPALRGGNDNPGVNETFYGEVDDILAAANYLAQQDYVDPERIYLGGHSTGGTLVLLCAAASDRFRAVFSFGPIHDISKYGSDSLTFDPSDQKELQLRNPIQWLHAIKNPTYVIEGAQGNVHSLRLLRAENSNDHLHFYNVPNSGHFEVLGPMNELLARKVAGDTGESCNITLTRAELKSLVR
jgi:dienelactone hydrolase